MEKTQGITIDIQKKALQSYDRNAFVLEQFVKSITNAIRFSNTAMIVEHAAKNIQRKKIVPQILPALIALKMFGSVIKIRLGPLSG